MLKKENVYFRCLERWNADDEKTVYFKQHYDEWFSQLPEEIHEVVLQLLEMFMYYSQERGLRQGMFAKRTPEKWN